VAWTDQIFRYCERGADPSFWAEPLNATTNAAFLLAGVAALAEIARQPSRTRGVAETLLALLVLVIGTGSFLFHTYATRWAAIADTGPIGLFMLAYLAYALRVLLRLSWLTTAAGIVLFIAALKFAGDMECRPGLLSVTAAARGPCLNGTAGYLPAFLAMAAIGLVLALKRHPAWRYLLPAALVFLVSMVFRTVDLEVCALTRMLGKARGTHFLWHLLNATTLYLLLAAAIRHGRRR
jgi:hypothetical protein